MMFLFEVASHLGKSLEEVCQFSVAELSGWRYYFVAKHELHKENRNNK